MVLEENPGIEKRPGEKAGDAEIVSYGNEEVLVKVEDHSGGLLVLNDAHYPGWRAYVDGEERPILQANHAFRAVVIQPERGTRFRFESRIAFFGEGGSAPLGGFAGMLPRGPVLVQTGWVFPSVGEHEPTGRTVASPVPRGACRLTLRSLRALVPCGAER